MYLRRSGLGSSREPALSLHQVGGRVDGRCCQVTGLDGNIAMGGLSSLFGVPASSLGSLTKRVDGVVRGATGRSADDAGFT